MSTALKQMGIGLIASLAIFLLVMQMPQFGVFLLLIPALYIWLGFTMEPNPAYAVGSVFLVLTTLLVDHPLGMMIGLFGGLIPIAMTIVAKRDYLEDALVKTVIMTYAGLMATHYFMQQMFSIDLFVIYRQALKLFIDQLKQTGADTSGLFNTMSDSYLSVLFIMATGFALSLFITAAILKHFKAIQWSVQPFYTFRFKGLSFIQFGLIMLAIMVLSSLELPFRLVGQNGWRFMMTLFSIQGISVAYFFLKRRKVSTFISWTLLVLTLAMPLVNSLISLLGFSDSLFDFRKLEALK